MPTFETPEPIMVTVDLVVGNVKIFASDRTDTVVEVRPSKPSKKDDINAAEATKVDFVGGNLTITAPRGWRTYTLFGGNASIDVIIQVPTGSRLHSTASVSELVADGELGNCYAKTAVGDLQIDKAGPVELRASGGNITVDHVVGHADITTGSGIVRIREVNGTAIIKNSNGDNWIRDVDGEVQVKTANGNITVERAQGAITAKTSNGNIRVGDVARGTVQMETATGELEIGIHPGTAAWLDVNTKHGKVRNLMDTVEAPGEAADKVEVYARTSFGNVIVRHATAV